MNSPLEEHEVHLRGLGGQAECGVRGACASAAGKFRGVIPTERHAIPSVRSQACARSRNLPAKPPDLLHVTISRPQSTQVDFVPFQRRIHSLLEAGLPSRLPFAVILLAILLGAGDAGAQARTADSVAVVGMRVEPDTVTVGDRFRAAVFVRAPEGSRVALAVAPAADGAYQPVGEARAYPPDSAGVHRAVATMVVWVTDPPATARAEARVTLPGGAVRTFPIQLPLPFVRATLPADSAQPRPPKDIVETPRRDWTWAYALAAVLAALALLAWWLRRRRRPRIAPPADPRGHALAELDRLRASGLLETDVEAFAAGTSAVVRAFAATADPRLGPDLTTSELLDRLIESGARGEDVDAIERALTQADLAKFARRPPHPDRALQDWEASRRWVEGFRSPASTEAEPARAGR
jgi:hypothetical protein